MAVRAAGAGIATLCTLAGAQDVPTAQEPAANSKRRQLVTTQFSTSDGSRFLLVPTGGAPMLHLAIVSPAGELVDPPGYPHLSYATAQASLSGTDTIGTRNWAAERRHTRDIEILRAEIRDYQRRDESPPDSSLRALERTIRERHGLRDETEWLRRMQDAPTIDFSTSELDDATLLRVTTIPEGFGRVCRLLLDRRENTQLRTLERDYPLTFERRQRAAFTARSRLHAEIRELAFAGFGRRALKDDTPISFEDALEVYSRTQNPAATYHVITGGFDAAVVERFLRQQFVRTKMSPRPAPRAIRRNTSRMRSAEIEAGSRSGLGIAFELDADFDPIDAQILAEGIAGGEGSLLDLKLREGDFTDLIIRATTPFPSTAAHSFLLVEVWRPDSGGGSARELETEVTTALAKVFGRGSLDVHPIERAHRRTMFRRAERELDPADLARWLAIECGIRGVTPEEALKPGLRMPRINRFRLGLRMLSKANRIVVRVEAAQ